MIPEAAVEAAANVLDPRTMGSGGALAEKFKAENRAEARRILEAATPHIAAQALEDAAKEIVAPGASSVAAAWLIARADMIRPTP